MNLGVDGQGKLGGLPQRGRRHMEVPLSSGSRSLPGQRGGAGWGGGVRATRLTCGSQRWRTDGAGGRGRR